MEIPKYDECRLKEPEERTPLDNFVLYYAPTGREGLFAKNLIKLLEWVASQSGVEADAESRDDLEEQFSPHEWIPGGIDK